jgi:hypothetical protein
VYFIISLLLILGIAGSVAAQPTPSERDLFDLPETVDLLFAYHPVSDQAVFLVPAEGVSIIVFDTTPFDQIHAGLIGPSDWQTVDSLEFWLDETVVLRTSTGAVYKLAYTLTTGADVPRIQVTYAPVPPTLPDPSPPATAELAFYDALDVESGETFSDPTVASVLFCEAGPPPTPTPDPGVIPEPGTGLLLILGLLGLCAAWFAARRRTPTPAPSPILVT